MIPIIIITLGVVALILSLLLVSALIKIRKQKKIFESKTRGVNFIFELLQAQYGQGKTFMRLPLLKNTVEYDQNEYGTVKRDSDIVFVSNGGVLLITIINGRGSYHTPKSGPWKKDQTNARGDILSATLNNPFEATAMQVKAAENLLDGGGINNITVHRAVLFTSDYAVCTEMYAEILTPYNLFDYIDALNKRKLLTTVDVSAICNLISQFAEYMYEYDEENQSHNQNRRLRASKKLNLKTSEEGDGGNFDTVYWGDGDKRAEEQEIDPSDTIDLREITRQ